MAIWTLSVALWATFTTHVLHNLAEDLLLYRDKGVALRHFVTPLTPAEWIGFKLA